MVHPKTQTEIKQCLSRLQLLRIEKRSTLKEAEKERLIGAEQALLYVLGRGNYIDLWLAEYSQANLEKRSSSSGT